MLGRRRNLRLRQRRGSSRRRCLAHRDAGIRGYEQDAGVGELPQSFFILRRISLLSSQRHAPRIKLNSALLFPPPFSPSPAADRAGTRAHESLNRRIHEHLRYPPLEWVESPVCLPLDSISSSAPRLTDLFPHFAATSPISSTTAGELNLFPTST